jgi:hypothetical protein
MRARAAGLAIGVVFGVVLAWSGMTSPNVIREALLFESSYLFLFFASAVLVAAAGLALVRRRRSPALLASATVDWVREQPRRRHILGSLLFGLGWGLADACPGPILTQIGQGIGWAVFTFVGAGLGVYVFVRRENVETEPATDGPVRTRPREAAATS